MLFIFFALTSQIMEYTQNQTIEPYNANYDKTRTIDTNLFSYSSTGDKDGNPISNILTDANNYWIAKDTSIGNSRSAIFIYFKKTISLEAFLTRSAYVTKSPNRAYSGHPLKVNVYASLYNNPLKIHAIFSGHEPTLASWGEGAQFTFNEPIVCDKIKIEFEKVTPDTFFGTNDECAIIRQLILLGTVAPDQLHFEKVNGLYADNDFVNKNKIPSSSFSYTSNGDMEGHAIGLAFDDNTGTYWVAKDENSDTMHSAITVSFNAPTTIDAILYDCAYRTRGTTRYFDGFPLVLNIYESSGNSQFTLRAVFSGTPSGTNWGRTQFVLKKPITCKELKIEFVEVTPDGSFSSSAKHAVAGGFCFINKDTQKFQHTQKVDNPNSYTIPTSYFNYSSTGDRDDNPISNAFDPNMGKYWVAKDPSTESTHSSIFINFIKPVLLDAILTQLAYSTSGTARHFHGFPTKLNIYASLGQEQLSLKYKFEGEAPTTADFGSEAQFSFKDPFICDRLQIEFEEVTIDNHFSNQNCAVVRKLYIKGNVLPDSLTLTGTTGSYDDSGFLSEYMLQPSSYTSTGDQNGKPISNAFDQNPSSYWVSDKENTDDFKSSITINVYSDEPIAAILYDSAYRSRTVDGKDVRYFDGFPIALTVSISTDNSDLFVPEAIFTGEPVFPWRRTQFVFSKPIVCKKIKLEFTDVTPDASFSDSKKCAVSGGIYLIKDSFRLPSIPSEDGVVEIPQNKCNTHFRCDVNITSNNVITIDLRGSSFSKFNNNVNGGAISLINCGTLFSDSTFSECSSAKGGGAIFFQNDLQRENNFELIDIDFINCSAAYGGAAYIYSRQAQVEIRGCKFINDKLLNEANAPEHFRGGSALFLTVKNGNFQGLRFEKCEDVIVKFYNSFDNKPSGLMLSNLFNNKKNMVLFSHCTFEFENPTNSLIYYVRGDNPDTLIKVSDCTFIGELQKGTKAIDGMAITNNSPRLFVEYCKFSSSSKELRFDPKNKVLNIQYSQSKESKDSFKSITAAVTPALLVIVIGIIIAALVIKRKSSHNDDGQKPSEKELNQA